VQASPLVVAAVHVHLQRGTLTVKLDPKSNGMFSECVTTYSVPISGEWYKKLYLGITASTGQLADNHDIIAVVTTEGDAVAPEKTQIVTPELSTGNPQIDAAIKVCHAMFVLVNGDVHISLVAHSSPDCFAA